MHCDKCNKEASLRWNNYRGMWLCSYCFAFAYDDDDWAELEDDE